MCEAQMHPQNMFLTLTYDDEHFPMHGDLVYRDWQLFAMKLRKNHKFRFFVSGEYSPDQLRPHWHALIFGLRFNDLEQCNSIYSQHTLYTSETVKKAWPFGFHTIGEVNATTARYCAKYTLSKVTGVLADNYYTRLDRFTGEIWQVTPEFSKMSLKPGIGFSWLQRYHPEVSVHDGVYEGSKKRRLPRYFQDKLDLFNKDVDWMLYERSLKINPEDNTDERLKVREAVEHARIRHTEDRKYKKCVSRLLP